MILNSKPKLHRLSGCEQVFVAAFGKHPGWDDHIENLGLETAALIGVRRTLYLEGVGKNLDSGAWEKGSDSGRFEWLEAFHHVFVSITSKGVVGGRMWSSIDGKGRSRYPMVVCAQGVDMPLPQFVNIVDSGLESVELQCKAAKTASEVKGILDQARSMLRGEVISLRAEGSSRKGEKALDLSLLSFLESTGLAEPREGLLRVLYQIERDFAVYTKSSRAARTERKKPKHFRVPVCGDDNKTSFLVWIAIFRSVLPGNVPLMLLRPLGYPWVDIVVGEARAQQLYCLRASLDAIPLVSDVPYNLSASFREHAEEWLNTWESGVLDLQQLLECIGHGKQNSACTRIWKQWLDQIKAIFVKG